MHLPIDFIAVGKEDICTSTSKAVSKLLDTLEHLKLEDLSKGKITVTIWKYRENNNQYLILADYSDGKDWLDESHRIEFNRLYTKEKDNERAIEYMNTYNVKEK